MKGWREWVILQLMIYIDNLINEYENILILGGRANGTIEKNNTWLPGNERAS
jgi:hypothetical protein